MWKHTLCNISYFAATLALVVNSNLASASIVTFEPLNPVYTFDQSPVTITIVGKDFIAGQAATDAFGNSTTSVSGTLGGGLSINWDASVLQLTSVNRLLDPSNTYWDPATGTIDNVAGTLTDLSVSSWNGNLAENFNIAELTFSFVSTGISSTAISLSALDVWTDSLGNLISVAGTGGSVTVSNLVPNVAEIPLPPAALLFGSILLGIVCVNRRKMPFAA